MSDGKILLVEDNPDDVLMTCRTFTRANVTNEIVVATDGREALDLLLPGEGGPVLRPALVLLDLNLPKISGLQLLQMLRADPGTELLPIAALTSSESDEDWVSSHHHGVNAFVRKPVLFGDVQQAAAVLGLFWTIAGQQAPHSGPWVSLVG